MIFNRLLQTPRELAIKRLMAFFVYKKGLFLDWHYGIDGEDTLTIDHWAVPEGTAGLGTEFVNKVLNLADRFGFNVWFPQLAGKGWTPGPGFKVTSSFEDLERFYGDLGLWSDQDEGMEYDGSDGIED